MVFLFRFRLEEKILGLARERAKHEGIDKDPRLENPNDPYYHNLDKYLMERLSYYMCFKCKEPYFGGLKECGNVADAEREYKPEELICGKCSSAGLLGKKDCKTHGTNYIDFKCRYCCSVALWFCWGTTHFCDPCHRKAWNFYNKKNPECPKCPGVDKCPLRIQHPPNGEEFALGCGLCRGA